MVGRRILLWFKRDRDKASLTARVKSLNADLKNAEATNRQLLATIRGSEATIVDSIAASQADKREIDRLEQLIGLKDEIIQELRLWVEEVQSVQEKRIAMHERARFLAIRSSQSPEPNNDDLLS